MSLTPFFIATLALNLAPGPDMTYVAARSLGQGRRAGLISALGISAGCLVHIAAASAGVAVLLRAWPRAYTAIRLAGAAYLLYLGISMWWSAGRGEGLRPVPRTTDWEIFRQGAITNILNPKVALFYLTFLPQFIPTGAPVLRTSLLLAMIHNVLGFAWLSLYARFVDRLRTALTRPVVKAWLERVTGGALVALGARLAWDRR